MDVMGSGRWRGLLWRVGKEDEIWLVFWNVNIGKLLLFVIL